MSHQPVTQGNRHATHLVLVDDREEEIYIIREYLHPTGRREFEDPWTEDTYLKKELEEWLHQHIQSTKVVAFLDLLWNFEGVLINIYTGEYKATRSEEDLSTVSPDLRPSSVKYSSVESYYDRKYDPFEHLSFDDLSIF